MATTITIRARAEQGSDLAKLRLLIDGQEVATTSVTRQEFGDLVFTVDDLASGQAHRIGVQHYNDTASRALYVESVTIGQTTVLASQGFQDVGALDGQNLKTGSAAGSITFNGTLLVDFPAEAFPAPYEPEPPPAGNDTTVIVVRAHAAEGSDLSKLRLLIDGREVAVANVTGKDFSELRFEVAGIAGGAAHEIGVQHYNDTAARALSIDWVEVNGVRLDGASGTQDVGALDGVNLVRGTAAETITFNGTLLLTAPASAFPTGSADYAQTAKALGAVMHLGFPEPGDAGRDTIGHLHAELRGGVDHGGAPLVGGQALHFDGVNDHVVAFTPGGDGRIDLMVLGDSLSALSTKHIDPANSYPTQLGEALTSAGHGDVDIIAYSKGGDTTAMGLARLQTYLADPTKELPDAVILELGTNDSLQTLSIPDVEANLRAILDLFEARGVEVLLAGTQGAWPLLGKGYWSAAGIARFEKLYPDLAAEYDAVLYRNFLDGVLDSPATLTTDNLHPNAAGTKVVVANTLPKVEELLDRAAGATLADPTELANGSLSFWFRADDLNGVQGLFSKDSAGANTGDTSLWLDGSRLVLRVEDAAGSHRIEVGGIEAGEAVHVGFSFGAGGTKLFVDGELAGSDSFKGNWLGDVDPLIFGALADQSSRGAADKLHGFFHGSIDEVSLFAKALSAAEIEKLFLSGQQDFF
jgi:acyl-CoA thioesterase-1